MKLCEICDDGYGLRREDNIYVCFNCDQKYPAEESKVGGGFTTKEDKSTRGTLTSYTPRLPIKNSRRKYSEKERIENE